MSSMNDIVHTVAPLRNVGAPLRLQKPCLQSKPNENRRRWGAAAAPSNASMTVTVPRDSPAWRCLGMHRPATKDPRARFRPQHQTSRVCDGGVRGLGLVLGYAADNAGVVAGSGRGSPRLSRAGFCHRFSRGPPALSGLRAVGGRHDDAPDHRAGHHARSRCWAVGSRSRLQPWARPNSMPDAFGQSFATAGRDGRSTMPCSPTVTRASG
jgi:hypothetical protein